jgi:hypothetical protein
MAIIPTSYGDLEQSDCMLQNVACDELPAIKQIFGYDNGTEYYGHQRQARYRSLALDFHVSQIVAKGGSRPLAST